ncbi:hypothetical protein AVEN_150418-1 [Araneus ventricosus]|uniref:SCP domain-containing protein n=1 Tax=Araneus ventricosus TaxID=182803 RepID=A0A4Y2ULV5_ARAVE|nr:hypothetical protein AVEN_150418-1 [Araneus ventricosus]
MFSEAYFESITFPPCHRIVRKIPQRAAVNKLKVQIESTSHGHFTQMVWRNSTEFGVGKARSRCGKVIVVANYKPGGNVIGEFQDNVFPPVNDMDILNEI